MQLDRVLKQQNIFWLCLLFGHLLILTALYSFVGFNVINEGDKYLTAAEELIKGNIQKAFAYKFLYSSYIIYLAIFKILKIPVVIIFASNYFISLFAYYLFFKFLSEKISFLHAKTWISLMLLSPLIQFWHFNLFSEAFFIALNLILVYCFFYSSVNNRIIKAVLLSVIIIFSRPSGIFSVGEFWFLYLLSNTVLEKKKLILFSFIGLILLFTGITFFTPLHYKGYCKDITMGSIYCGFPQYSEPITPKGDYTLGQCYQFLFQQHDFSTVLKLFIKKVDSFFVLSRPYYTNLHNSINLCHYLFYALGAFGVISLYKNKNFESNFYKVLFIIVVLNAILIGLFFNEWSERYTVAVFPFIFAAASGGIITLYHFFKKKFAI